MSEAVVWASGLSKRYQAGAAIVHALSDVFLLIERGEFVVVVGRSGSGKSTLLSLLGLLDRADTGHYSLAGRDVTSLDEETRARIRNREIGFVFQLPALLPRSTALENVEMPLAYASVGRAERHRRAMAALDRIDLSHRQDHWPHQLSGGEQQRVAIARALVNDPSLVLADEPTGALDSKTGAAVMRLLEDLHRDGQTIVVVTHDEDIAARAPRRITLCDGEIVQDERPHRSSLTAPSATM
jgi:putative ABC transport system ATP-binding protein